MVGHIYSDWLVCKTVRVAVTGCFANALLQALLDLFYLNFIFSIIARRLLCNQMLCRCRSWRRWYVGSLRKWPFRKKRYLGRISYIHYLPMPWEPTLQGLLYLIIANFFIEWARSRHNVLVWRQESTCADALTGRCLQIYWLHYADVKSLVRVHTCACWPESSHVLLDTAHVFSIYIYYSFLPERNHFMEPIPAPFLSRLKLACCWFESWKERCCVLDAINLSKCLRDLRQCFFLASLFFLILWLIVRSVTVWGDDVGWKCCSRSLWKV